MDLRHQNAIGTFPGLLWGFRSNDFSFELLEHEGGFSNEVFFLGGYLAEKNSILVFKNGTSCSVDKLSWGNHF